MARMLRATTRGQQRESDDLHSTRPAAAVAAAEAPSVGYVRQAVSERG